MNAIAGSQVLEVVSTTGFSIGDNITINPGGVTEETNTITGFGSLMLQTALQFNHNSGEVVELLISTAVEDNPGLVANDYTLLQNFPNPFNPSTTISWQSPEDSHQTLKIFDVLGNEVATLVNEYLPAGSYEVEFSAIGGSASGGNAINLTSGIYFYQLQSGNPSTGSGQGFVETKKMLMIK